jgi:hypothetical protein
MNTARLDPLTATGATDSQDDMSGADAQSRRRVLLKWLRKTHGWIGLWGAALGLVFGVTAILLNHRAIMKIPVAQAQESTVQLALPSPMPQDLDAMTVWLQKELGFDRPPARARSEPSKPVAWGDKTLKQPAHWSFLFATPQNNVAVDFWVGNNFATAKRNQNNLFGTLNNLHKGAGVGVGWVLLADTLAGAIILLSLTGVLLWTLTNRRRALGAGIGLTSLILMIVLAVQTL